MHVLLPQSVHRQPPIHIAHWLSFCMHLIAYNSSKPQYHKIKELNKQPYPFLKELKGRTLLDWESIHVFVDHFRQWEAPSIRSRDRHLLSHCIRPSVHPMWSQYIFREKEDQWITDLLSHEFLNPYPLILHQFLQQLFAACSEQATLLIIH